MRNRFTRFIFPIVAVLLLAPWPIAYAYDAAAGGGEPVQVRAADASAGPSGVVFGKARGSVKAGDLFYVDASTAGDVTARLNITNIPDLTRFLSYMTLRVGVYRDNNGKWEPALGVDGLPFRETYITLHSPETALNLAGGAKYKITIDGGNFYSYVSKPGDAVVSPRFYLVVN